MAKRFRLTRKERITYSKDFSRVMKLGRRKTSPNFILFTEENQKAFHRLGIVVKKEIGPATYRNSMKRYVREFFRLYKHQIKGSFDMVFLIKKGCSVNRYKEAEGELRRLLFYEQSRDQ